MGMFEHNPKLVEQLTELGLSQQDAIDCLRATNNDMSKAADLWFSDGLEEWKRNNTWDEGAFHRDRYDNNLEPLEPLTGWSQNSNVNNPPRTSTRPATEFSHLSLPMMRYLEMQDRSRVGTPNYEGGEDRQHLLGGALGDDDDIFGHDSERATAYSSSHSNVDYSIQSPDVLTPDVLGGPPRTRPSSPMNPGLDGDTNRSDADIARALQMSLDDDYNPSDYDTRWGNQETGITGAHSTPTAPYFGPATRESYNEAQWALTTVPVTHEIYLDPAHPSDRQRKEGEPAFFKPSSDGFHLGPALAILHSIPAAREALLAPQLVIDDYGYNERWWSGEKIEASRITNITENDGTEEITVGPEPGEVVTEVQRLMAFLDRTMRGYGSVDSLAQLPGVHEQAQGDQLATFFKKWSSDIKQLCKLNSLDEPKPFTSIAVETGSNMESENKDFFQVLTVRLSSELLVTTGATLYNAIDQVIWPEDDFSTGDNGDVYLDYVSDVFCITLCRETNDQSGVNLDIPTELYLNRYSVDYINIARGLKAEKERIKEEIRNLEKREERLLRCRKSQAVVDTSTVETTKLIESTIAHFEYLKLPTDEPENISDNTPMEVDGGNKEQDGFFLIIQHLQGILDRLKVRLAELATSKKKAQESLDELTKAFTSPETTPKDIDAPPLTTHSLRGAFIDSSTTFIKIRTDSQQPGSNDEWWCLSYPLQWESDTNTSAYKVMKVDEKEVLSAVKYTGEGKALLIYATEEAMQARGTDGKLPEPLKSFVEHDNVVFMQELENAGDKGKRKRGGNWWKNNNNHGITIPRISIKDPNSGLDGDPGPSTGVRQPPASPTEFVDTNKSLIPLLSSPGGYSQKTSLEEGEWFTHGQEGFTGEVGGQGTQHTAGSFSPWMGGETSNNDWARMDEGATGQEMKWDTTASGGEEVTERRYDGNFRAKSISPREVHKDTPEEMGFEKIGGEEDEEMKDVQHVEDVGRSENITATTGASVVGDGKKKDGATT